VVGDDGLMDRLGGEGWTSAYLRWELVLLEELGFGLDLSSCAVTGATEGLAFVSPKTGRAVTAAGAGDWADRLLPLPEGLTLATPLDLPGDRGPAADRVLPGPGPAPGAA
jgi:DNA repair protein RecO (recombination protein O)